MHKLYNQHLSKAAGLLRRQIMAEHSHRDNTGWCHAQHNMGDGVPAPMQPFFRVADRVSVHMCWLLYLYVDVSIVS